MRKTIFLMAIFLLASGCASLQNPRVQLVAANEAFTAVCQVLTRQIQAGAFDAEELADIERSKIAADEFLDLWETCLLAGVSPPAAEAADFGASMRKLRAYSKRKERADGS